jgi:hypothetical protein
MNPTFAGKIGLSTAMARKATPDAYPTNRPRKARKPRRW